MHFLLSVQLSKSVSRIYWSEVLVVSIISLCLIEWLMNRSVLYDPVTRALEGVAIHAWHALSRVRELTFIHKNHSILGTRFITRFVSHGTVIHVWIIDTGWKSDGYRCGWGILVEDRGQSFPFTRKEIYSWPETVSWKNFYSDRILEEFRIYLPWLNVFYPLNSW